MRREGWHRIHDGYFYSESIPGIRLSLEPDKITVFQRRVKRLRKNGKNYRGEWYFYQSFATPDTMIDLINHLRNLRDRLGKSNGVRNSTVNKQFSNERYHRSLLPVHNGPRGKMKKMALSRKIHMGWDK